MASKKSVELEKIKKKKVLSVDEEPRFAEGKKEVVTIISCALSILEVYRRASDFWTIMLLL